MTSRFVRDRHKGGRHTPLPRNQLLTHQHALAGTRGCRSKTLRLRLQVPARDLTDPDVNEVRACCIQSVHASTGTPLQNKSRE